MNKDSTVTGKVVMITGASSGIGEATAWEFGKAGARTVLTARRAERLNTLADRIRAEGGTALPIPADITHAEQIRHLVRETLAAFGRIDVLVNIAGWGHYDWFEELTQDTLRQQYEVNIIGMAELIRQVLPTMKAQRSGIIINMSSYSSRISVPPLTVYSSTKYAVEGLSDGLRRELAPWGIKVIRIHPSAVTGTEFKDRATANGGVEYSTLPIGRVSREVVARAIVHLTEQPQRAFFIGRSYEVAAISNWLIPAVIDWISINWVRKERWNEFRQVGLVSLPPVFGWTVAGALGMVLIRYLVQKKHE